MLTIARSQADIERAILAPDLDYELARAQKYRYVRDPRSGLVRQVPTIKGGGSGLSGSFTELLYSNPTAGTAKASFTTEFQINDTTGMGAIPAIPPYFFWPGKARGKALRICARGVASVTATPTWIWTFRLNPVATPAVPPTGPIVGINSAATALSGVTAQLWQAELDVQFRIDGAPGNNSTLVGLGLVNAPGLFTPAATSSLFGGSASPGTVATFDYSVMNTLTVGSTCSANSASNSIQLLQLLVFDLN